MTINNYFIASYGYANSSAVLTKVKNYESTESDKSQQTDFFENNKITYYLELNTNRFKMLCTQSILFFLLLLFIIILLIVFWGSSEKNCHRK